MRRSRALAAGVALAACGGGDRAGPDAGAGEVDAAAAPAGTWDAPFVITALPFRGDGDTTGGERRAARYDCALVFDEGGAEVCTGSTWRRRRSSRSR